MRTDMRPKMVFDQRRNVKARETGDARENPPINGIVQKDCHLRKSGSDPAGHGTQFAFGVEVLKGVRIRVPEAVRAGDTVKLACDYDLEDSPLYTIKWYRSDEEFYRYVPKESPATKVFPKPGINVDVAILNVKVYSEDHLVYYFPVIVFKEFSYSVTLWKKVLSGCR
ncbi:hypothetical protein PR048_017023 [Dryococelus australis]|uniref:Ig-like domain-containing protein n=1 Tax=Dryococelus australis TaxID=614101 RepID=A0ABQ9H8Y1_9NEOP|nr:hypothetical protein PR048_017023 [Dryococelus australis]